MAPTLSEIVNASSTQEIRTLYENNGFQFESEKAFLKQVSADWKQLREEHTREPKEMPSTLQPLEVITGGVEYRIYGIVHLDKIQEAKHVAKYEKVVYQSLEGQTNLVSEQSIHAAFPDLTKLKQILELGDHTVRKEWCYVISFKMGIGMGVVIPLLLPLIPVHFITGCLSGFRINLMEKMNIAALSSQEPAQLKMMNLTYSPETVALFHPLPPIMEIERREQNKLSYTSNQAASAYMAEFVRVWKPKEAKPLLVGAGHAHEIKYFLEHGVKDQHIIDLAVKHAWWAQRKPLEYEDVVVNMKKQELAVSAAGFVAGLSASAFMGYKAYHLLF